MRTRNLADERLHQNDLLELALNDYSYQDYLYRANGELLCGFCERKLKDHPHYLDSYDHQLCNGDVVHL